VLQMMPPFQTKFHTMANVQTANCKIAPQYALQRVGGLCLGIREGHRTGHGTGFMLSSIPGGPRFGIGETLVLF
jgi:hypothetical protein